MQSIKNSNHSKLKSMKFSKRKNNNKESLLKSRASMILRQTMIRKSSNSITRETRLKRKWMNLKPSSTRISISTKINKISLDTLSTYNNKSITSVKEKKKMKKEKRKRKKNKPNRKKNSRKDKEGDNNV